MRIFTRPITLLLSTICLMVAVTSPGNTQETALNTTGVVNLYGLTLQFPLPDWVDATEPENILGQSNYRRDEQLSYLFIDQIPAQESFDSYANLYKIAATRGSTASLEGAISTLIEENRAHCTKDTFAPFASNPVPDGALVTILCGDLTSANSEGRGMILHSRVFQRDTVSIYVTREWIGNGFQLSDGSDGTRPVSPADFEALSNRLLADTALTGAQRVD